MNTIVSIRRLSKIYGAGETEIRALDDVSLDIEFGEFLALMGPPDPANPLCFTLLRALTDPPKASAMCREWTSQNSASLNLLTGEIKTSDSSSRHLISSPC